MIVEDIIKRLRNVSQEAIDFYNKAWSGSMLYKQPNIQLQKQVIDTWVNEMGVKIDVINAPVGLVGENYKGILENDNVLMKSRKYTYEEGDLQGCVEDSFVDFIYQEDIKTIILYQWVDSDMLEEMKSYGMIRLGWYDVEFGLDERSRA